MNQNTLFNKMLVMPIFKPLIYSACKQPEQSVKNCIYKIHSFIKYYIKTNKIPAEDFVDFSSDLEEYTSTFVKANNQFKNSCKMIVDSCSDLQSIMSIDNDEIATCRDICTRAVSTVFESQKIRNEDRTNICNNFFECKLFCSSCPANKEFDTKKALQSQKKLLMSFLKDPKKTGAMISKTYYKEWSNDFLTLIKNNGPVLCFDLFKLKPNFTTPILVDPMYHVVKCFENHSNNETDVYIQETFLDYICDELINYPFLKEYITPNKVSTYYFKKNSVLEYVLEYFGELDKDSLLKFIKKFDIPDNADIFAPYLELLKQKKENSDDTIISCFGGHIPISEGSSDKEIPQENTSDIVDTSSAKESIIPLPEQDNKPISNDNEPPVEETNDVNRGVIADVTANNEEYEDNNGDELDYYDIFERTLSDKVLLKVMFDPILNKYAIRGLVRIDDDGGGEGFIFDEFLDDYYREYGFKPCHSLKHTLPYHNILTVPKYDPDDVSPRPRHIENHLFTELFATPLSNREHIEDFMEAFDHNDKCMPVEVLADKDDVFYLLFYCDYNKKYYYLYFEDELIT